MFFVFRTDASEEIGSGHIMRCATLADALQKNGHSVLFICRQLLGNMTDWLSARFNTYLLKGEPEDDAFETKQVILVRGVKPDWLIVDHHQLDATWEATLKPVVQKLMVIDDLANRPHDCDVLLDQNYFPGMPERYQKLLPATADTLLGPSYALVRPDFLKHRPQAPLEPSSQKRILVFFGGSDPTHETEKALSALENLLSPNLHLDVVVGSINPRKEEIKRRCERTQNTTYHCQVDNMAALYSHANIAIGAGGISIWERCCIGTPSIVITVADNQVKIVESMAKEGYLHYLGNSADVSAKQIEISAKCMLENLDWQLALREKRMKLVDGQGTRRIIEYLTQTPLTLRPAKIEDAKRTYEWRNHPSTRCYFFNSNPISWEDHHQWFEKAILKPDRILLIGEREGEDPVGVVRYDLEDEKATVSIYVDPEQRGHALGTYLLMEGNRWLKRNAPQIKRVEAHILHENIASQRAFEKAGYRQQHNEKGCQEHRSSMFLYLLDELDVATPA